jgi:hypothetical protein
VSRFLHNLLPSRKSVQLVGLSARGAAWLASSATGVQHWQQAAWDACLSASSVSAALKSVMDLVAPSQAQGIAWILAPSLARSWVQFPSPQIVSLAELHAVAQARASQLFGEPVCAAAPGAPWAVTADWQASRPFLCVASPSAWVQSLQALSQGGKNGQILSPLTLALDGFKQQIPASGWLAMAVAGELSISHWTGGRISRLRSVRLPAGSTPEAAQTLAMNEWQRELLRSQENSSHLSWLCLMPGTSQGDNLPGIRSVEWTPSPRFTALPFLNTPGAFTESQAALDEAMLTAWSGQQLLEKANR